MTSWTSFPPTDASPLPSLTLLQPQWPPGWAWILLAHFHLGRAWKLLCLGCSFPRLLQSLLFTLSACRSFSKVTYIDRSSLSIPTDNVSTSLCLILPYHLSSSSFISSQCSLVPNIIYISTLYLVILLSYHPNASEEQGFLSVLCCVLESGIVPAYLKDQ